MQEFDYYGGNLELRCFLLAIAYFCCVECVNWLNFDTNDYLLMFLVMLCDCHFQRSADKVTSDVPLNCCKSQISL